MSEWWSPKPTNHEWCDTIRKDYPEYSIFSDEVIRDEFAEGRKYKVLWNHIGDAYDEYEPLATAYLKLLSIVENMKGN